MSTIVITEFKSELTEELIVMWRASFEYGVGIEDPHPLAEQREYFHDEVLPTNTLRLALIDRTLVGFVAATPESISQLYVRVANIGQGIGTSLLDWAKSQSYGNLWLYTFARNENARRFYEHNGFTIVARGFEPKWKLDDLKYAWSAQALPTATK